MSIIAEFTIETPILQPTLAAVPGMTLYTETIHLLPDDPWRGMIWAWGGDFGTFERRLGDDPTIEEYKRLAEVEGRRLYRLVFTDRGREALTYPVMAEHDIVMLNAVGTHEGLQIRARFPGRDALMAYREACRERDVPFHLRSLYPEGRVAGDGGSDDPYGLTDPQREALRAALEMGYFAVPRGTTLDDVADELGVSVQAVSTRLRRGQRNLLRAALG